MTKNQDANSAIEAEFITRKLTGPTAKFATIFCVVVSLIHIYLNSIGLIEVVQKNMIHISLMMGIVFLFKPFNSSSPMNRPSVFDWLLFALSIYVGVYLLLSYPRWVETFMKPSSMDIVYGVIFLVVMIESARRAAGLMLTTLACVFLLYTYVGPYMPMAIAHQGYTVERILTRITMTSEGILGVAVMVSASYIFMFILFASFLKATKASDFFNDLSSAISGHKRGGPAKTAIFASALTGTISGSSQANVATTGSFTIPLMKSVGYRPYFAASVETIASTGGILMPPVMGAAAFIMASYLAIPYNDIMLAAVTPAVLYYWTLYHMVDLGAAKWNIVGIPKENLPDVWEVLRTRGHLLAPLIFIIVFLILGFSPLLAAFIGLASVLVVSSFRKETRMGYKDIIAALAEGARNGADIAVICGIIGFIVASVGMTGLGQVIGSNIVNWSGSNLFLTAFFCMITAIILGMGLPGPACYIITATIAAPALVKIGVLPLVAHFFAFYFGTMSAVIPPVALTSFTAAAIANANPTKVAFTGLFLGSAGLLLPFAYLYNPVLLWVDFSLPEYLFVVGMALVGFYGTAIAIIGHLNGKLPWVLRLIFAAVSILMLSPETLHKIIGITGFIVVYYYRRYKRSSIESIANS